MINVSDICEIINLHKDIRKRVLDFDKSFNYCTALKFMDKFQDRNTREEGRLKLKYILGEDIYGVKILTCMLHCAAEAYTKYEQLGISNKIFADTMKCFTRFINEHYESYGYYAFDRDWWTTRQISLQLFRIGELEYELGIVDGKKTIKLHIPSDAFIMQEKCDKSLSEAKKLISTKFTDYGERDWTCHSWLLSSALIKLLPVDSNILRFQRRFRILSCNEDSDEFLEWVYKRKDFLLKELPENTTLQRNMKKYLLSGGKVGDAFGILNL